MPLPSSQLSLSEIQSYLGGASPTNLSEYYIDGLYTRGFPAPSKKVPFTSAGNRGYYAGGETGFSSDLSSTTEAISFSNGTTYNVIGELPPRPELETRGIKQATGLSGLSSGYIVAGRISRSAPVQTTNTIAKFNFSTESSSLLSNKLSYGDFGLNSVGNNVMGFVSGGISSYNNSSIVLEVLLYSTDTTYISNNNSSIFSQPSVLKRYESCSVTTQNNGYLVGGTFDGFFSRAIGKLNYGTETSVNISAFFPHQTGLVEARTRLSSSYNLTHGYFYGGMSSSTSHSAEIDGIVFNTETSINPSTFLSSGRIAATGVGNNLSGYIAGGYIDSVTTSSIDVFNMTTQTRTVNGSSLRTAKQFMTGLSARGSFQNEINFSDFNSFVPYTGYFAGGIGINNAHSSEIDGLMFNSEISTNPSAVLSVGRRSLAGVNSSTSGYFGGGSVGNTYYNSIDKFIFTGETSSALSATLSVNRTSLTGVNSSTNGYFVGGSSLSNSLLGEIDGINFTSETAINPSAVLAVPRNSLGGVNSSTVGYFGGGFSSTNYSNEIDGIAFNTESVINPSATLTYSASGVCGVNSQTSGYFSGGFNPNMVGGFLSIISKFNFSSETSSAISNIFSSGRASMGGVNSSTVGYFGGGDDNSTFHNRLDRLSFDTETSSNLGAILSVARSSLTGVQSGSL